MLTLRTLQELDGNRLLLAALCICWREICRSDLILFSCSYIRLLLLHHKCNRPMQFGLSKVSDARLMVFNLASLEAPLPSFISFTQAVQYFPKCHCVLA